jgi:hypothetical protein
LRGNIFSRSARTAIASSRANQSYHGNTLGALAAGGNEWRRRQFAPMLVETSHISPCYEYRGREDGESAFDYGQRVANELEAEIERLGPRNGARLHRRAGRRRDGRRGAAGRGLFQAHPRDLRQIRHPADPRRGDVRHGPHRHICSPASRTASRPTSCAIAKGLGAGYQPIGAMLCTG